MSIDSLLHRVRQWVADEPVVYECRNCGTTLEDSRENCPRCGGDHVVSYSLN